MKIIGVPPARLRADEERVCASAVLEAGDAITVYAGRRHLTLRAGDLDHYALGRGRRGRKLPRGFQRVDRIVAER